MCIEFSVESELVSTNLGIFVDTNEAVFLLCFTELLMTFSKSLSETMCAGCTISGRDFSFSAVLHLQVLHL